nr:MAG TPA: cell division suppressor protein [Caudoviricetes sp.]
MSKPLIFTVLLMATALLAGYAAEPEPQLISYKVTLRSGESVWDACAKVASGKDDVREVVYNTLKENHISNPGSIQPGTELVIRVKEMK